MRKEKSGARREALRDVHPLFFSSLIFTPARREALRGVQGVFGEVARLDRARDLDGRCPREIIHSDGRSTRPMRLAPGTDEPCQIPPDPAVQNLQRPVFFCALQ